MTLLLLAIIVFVVVCLAGFAAWVGAALRVGRLADELTDRDVTELTRPAGNISVVQRRGKD